MTDLTDLQAEVLEYRHALEHVVLCGTCESCTRLAESALRGDSRVDFDAQVSDTLDLTPLSEEMALCLRSHLEHASTWPAGWVRWTRPLPWRIETALRLGLLTEGSPEEGTVSVHITDAGREFLR